MPCKYNKEELWYIANYLINYLVHSKDVIANKRIAGYLVLNSCKEQLEAQVKIGLISSVNVNYMLDLIGWTSDNQRVDLNSVIINLKQIAGVLYRALHVFDLNKSLLDSLYAGGQINTKVYDYASLLLDTSVKNVCIKDEIAKKVNTVKKKRAEQNVDTKTVSSYVELRNNSLGAFLIDWVSSVVKYERYIDKVAIVELFNFIVTNGDYYIKVTNSMADYPSTVSFYMSTVSDLLTSKGIFVRRELNAGSAFVIGKEEKEKIGTDYITYIKNNTALHSKLHNLLVKLNLRY